MWWDLNDLNLLDPIGPQAKIGLEEVDLQFFAKLDLRNPFLIDYLLSWRDLNHETTVILEFHIKDE